MNVGILGGAFDPPHLGHLILAQACLEEVPLDEVWWMPSAQPPHKNSKSLTPWEHRLAMVRLAIVGNAAFRVETIEESLPAPNYTFQTLAALRQAHPEHRFHLILGGDSLADLPQWREPLKVIEQAGLVVYPRPGSAVWDEEGWRRKMGMSPEQPLSLIRIQGMPMVDIASRDIRARVAQGRSIRYQVPRAVEVYARQNALYEPSGS